MTMVALNFEKLNSRVLAKTLVDKSKNRQHRSLIADLSLSLVKVITFYEMRGR
tara:strand:+ start:6311 stop:6469 length:159 start_codon:yes stop_codon:yes gene_type:complete